MNPYFADSAGQFESKLKMTLNDLAPVDLGTLEPSSLQSDSGIAIGPHSGVIHQNDFGIAVGSEAGRYNQGEFAIAVGAQAGQTDQSAFGVALGTGAGANNAQTGTVAIGYLAGNHNQQASSIAIGAGAGQTALGTYSIAIGSGAVSTLSNSLVVNASGVSVSSTNSNQLIVAPLRNASTGNQLIVYDSSSNEVLRSNKVNSNVTVNGDVDVNGVLQTQPAFFQQTYLPTNTVDRTTLAGLTCELQWDDSVLAPNGKLYCFPFQATTVLTIDPATNTTNLTAIKGFLGGSDCIGGVLGLDGKIYGIPNNLTYVPIVDPNTNTMDTTSISGLTPFRKWSTGVRTSDGKIYGIPRNATGVLIIDPSSPVTALTGTFASATYTNSTRVLVCPGANFTGQLTIGDNLLITIQSMTFMGYVQSINSSSSVTLFYALDISLPVGSILNIQRTRRADFTSIAGLPSGTKWSGGVLAPDGKIYGFPSDSPTSVLIIDPNSPVTALTGTFASATYTNSTRVLVCPGANFTGQLTIGDNIIFTTTTGQFTGYVQVITNATTLTLLYALGSDFTAGTITNLQRTLKADVTSIAGLPTAVNKWQGSVLAPNGKIYGIPISVTNVLVIDPTSPVTALTGTFASATYTNSTRVLVCPGANFTGQLTIGDNIIFTTTTGQFTGYVQFITNATTLTLLYALGSNFVAGTITNLQRTRKADVIEIAGLSTVTSKWNKGVLAPNGKIYAIPANSTSVLIIDPTSPVTALTGTFASATYTNSTQVLVCPGANFTGQLTIGDNIIFTTTTGQFTGYVQVITNATTLTLLYALGSDFTAGTITNLQRTRKADVTTISNLSTELTKWAGGSLAPNGNIYATPNSTNSVLIINPNTNTTNTIVLPVGMSKYLGGVLAPNRKIYGFPFNATNVLIVDPVANTLDTTAISGLVGLSKWSGGVVAPNGKIYGIPTDSASVLIVEPNIPNTALTGTILSATYNDSTRILNCPGANFTGQLTVGDNIIFTTTTGQFTGYVQVVTSATAVTMLYALGFNFTAGTIINLQRTRKADVTTITGLTTTSSKWFGGVLSQDGKIYGIPRGSNAVLSIDPNSPVTALTGTFTSATYIDIIKSLICPGVNFMGQLTIGDNIIITTTTGTFTGYVATIVNPITVTLLYTLGSDFAVGTILNLQRTRKADVSTIQGLTLTATKWEGGVLAPDGKIYGIPADSTSVLIIDPTSPVTALTGTFASATYTNSTRVLVCPGANFTGQLTIGDNILFTTTAGIFTGYVQFITNATTLTLLYALGSDFIAGTITNLQRTRKADVTTITGLPSGGAKWSGGVLASDGKMYGIPYSSTSVLIIDPTSPVTALTGTVASATYTNSTRVLICPGANFTGQLTIGDNILFTTTTGTLTGYVQFITNATTLTLLYALGSDFTAGTITNLQRTRKADVTTITGIVGSTKWRGGTLSFDGKIYGIPVTTNILVVDPSSPVTALTGTFASASYTNSTLTLTCPGANFIGQLSTGDNLVITTTTGVLNGYVQTITNATTVTLLYALGANYVAGTITNLQRTRKVTFLPFGASNKFNTGVLAPNGKIYALPQTSPSVGQITPSLPALPNPWMLEPYFNKF